MINVSREYVRTEKTKVFHMKKKTRFYHEWENCVCEIIQRHAYFLGDFDFCFISIGIN